MVQAQLESSYDKEPSMVTLAKIDNDFYTPMVASTITAMILV